LGAHKICGKDDQLVIGELVFGSLSGNGYLRWAPIIHLHGLWLSKSLMLTTNGSIVAGDKDIPSL
jgi:hypothetical protein